MEYKKYLIIFGLFLLGFVITAEEHREVAIKGYDPVAYFTQSSAIKGNVEIFVEYNGAYWLFSSEYHKELFLADPVKYTPYFYEYCANGLADGHVVEANPKYWLMDKDRLFLFYSDRGRRSWLAEDLETEVQKAREYYKKAVNHTNPHFEVDISPNG